MTGIAKSYVQWRILEWMVFMPDERRCVTLQSLAERIATALFTSGNGGPGEFAADHLKLISRTGQDLGGWSYGPASHQIQSVLERAAREFVIVGLGAEAKET